VTLSGMSNLEQLRENIGIYEKCRPLNEKEAAALRQTAAKMLGVNTVPCTACRYCTAYCPMELDIPELLRLYNEHAFSGGGFIAPMALNALPEDKKPSACIGCRSCEAVCPQQIKISETFADFVKKLKK
ncbi:MAG: 4Fe-4S dicluster domain-containing protein, partial [Clostridia bacterium]|nr:4Fe-4S dicluster domain-containing protein [Clostridia bacterium]